MKRVMVFGTFDELHQGHINFFGQAKKKGDYLIVVVARDINVKKAKGHWPKIRERERLKKVKSLKLADKLLLGQQKNKFKIIKKIKPEIICLGYDQKITRGELTCALKKFKIKAKIYRLKAYRPKQYKSSILKFKKYA